MKLLIALEGKLNQGPNIGTNILFNELLKNYNKNTNKIHIVETTNIKSLIHAILHLRKYDVFHFYSESPGASLLFILFKIFGKKVVYTLHGNIFIESKSKPWPISKLWVPSHLFVIKNANAVIFPTKYLETQINEYLKTKKHTKTTNHHVIPNGIYIEKYDKELILKKADKLKEIQNGNASLNILSITSFVFEQKTLGVDLLINVNKLLNDRGIKTELKIAGIGKKLPMYKNKYESEKIKFLGYCNNKTENQWADLFIHLSYLDNLPYVILNAGASGIPTIASNIGGIPEIFTKSSDNKVWGLTNNDPETIADNIQKLIQDKDFYYDVSQKQYENIKENFNIEKISNQIWNLYLSL